MNKYKLGMYVACLSYNAFLLGGTAWLVSSGWSAWWFVPAFGLCNYFDYKEKLDD